MNYETHYTPIAQRAQLPQEPRIVRPREPHPGFTREQREHAEFILSTRETALELAE